MRMLKGDRSRYLLPLVVLYLYAKGSAPFLGQWDSYDYLKQIASHRLSDLGLGRPVYIAYNIALWEALRKPFRLGVEHLELVVMGGTIALAVLGVLLFRRLAERIVPGAVSGMAVSGLALSPLYAVYAGFVMTEVPMLTALLAAALWVWDPRKRRSGWADVAGGVCFGLAAGIREQALTMGPAFLWILWSVREGFAERFRATLRFFLPAVLVTLAPAAVWYVQDPAGFLEHTRTWFHAIPLGSSQFKNNVEACLLFTFILCPAAWLTVTAAGTLGLWRKPRKDADLKDGATVFAHPAWGVFCCLLLPLAVLWRNADIQMHPRYVLVVLPSAVLFCAALSHRWMGPRRSMAVWAVMHVLLFGASMAVYSQYSGTQSAKMEFAGVIRQSVVGEALVIAGNYSPVLDYYRGIGLRPGWQIVWSGWEWEASAVRRRVEEAWAAGVPVYWSTHAPGWSYFERELLEAYFLFKDCRKEPVAPFLYRILPPMQQARRTQ